MSYDVLCKDVYVLLGYAFLSWIQSYVLLVVGENDTTLKV